MKRLMFALAIGALLATSGLAVRIRAEEKGPGMKGHGDRKEWKAKLGLTADQEAKWDAAVKNREEAAKPLHETQKKAMETLRSQLDSKAGDSAIQATLDQIKQNEKAMEGVRESFRSEIDTFLTPTQKAKMVTEMGDRMKEHRGKWGDHKGMKKDK